MTENEKMVEVCKYIKEQVPSIIHTFVNTAKGAYKSMADNINKCAIKQRNWRMYLVGLGGNGRHRNIRKAIRLMANSKRPRVNKQVIQQMYISNKGPESGISHDFTIYQ